MSYAPKTDFLGLLRQTAGGVRDVSVPGLDYIVAALARAGLITLSVSQTAPTSNQSTTAWFLPASPSYAGEGQLFLWNAVNGDYELATPALWQAFLGITTTLQTKVITSANSPYAPLATDTYLLVDATAGAVEIDLAAGALRTRQLTIKDYKGQAATHNITVRPAGSDTLDGYANATPLVLSAAYDGVRLTPLATGYTIDP